MSVNRFKKHLIILPEDDGIRQVVNGFLTDISVDAGCVDVRRVAGGWIKTKDAVARDLRGRMTQYPNAHLLVLVDLDTDIGRVDHLLEVAPAEYRDRVYVLGIKGESEDLRRDFGMSLESIGKEIATGCVSDVFDVWNHDRLSANGKELRRIRNSVRPFLVDPGRR
jgi:hypothetical protein